MDITRRIDLSWLQILCANFVIVLNVNTVGYELKLMWGHIRLSGLTAIYFIFSITRFLTQIILQFRAFHTNNQSAIFLYSILIQGNATDLNGFTVLRKDGLRLCTSVPRSFSTSSCVLLNTTQYSRSTFLTSSSLPAKSGIFFSTQATQTFSPITTNSVKFVSPQVTQTVSEIPTSSVDLAHTMQTLSTPTRTTVVASSQTVTTPTSSVVFSLVHTTQTVSTATQTVVVTQFNTVNVTLSQALTTPTPFVAARSEGRMEKDNGHLDYKRHKGRFGTPIVTHGSGHVYVKFGDNVELSLDSFCVSVLAFPVDTLLNTKREDVTLIALHFWVLGMSMVAILQKSIAHIIAAQLAHTVVTAWAGFQIKDTANFKADFSRLVTHGACAVNLLPRYWEERSKTEIPLLALNVGAMLISAFLTWKLVELFGWQTFNRLGASLTINRVYKLVLILSISIQLSLLFMVVSIALWIDQLQNGKIAHLSRMAFVYELVFIGVLLIMVPFLIRGWFTVHRELRIPRIPVGPFWVMSLGSFVGSGIMFLSANFRWTFVLWRFFSLIVSSSIILTIIAFILGLLLRLNFDNSLLCDMSGQVVPIQDESVPDPRTSRRGEYDPEMITFPSPIDAILIISPAFDSAEAVRPLNQMFTGQQRDSQLRSESARRSEQQLDAPFLSGPSPYTTSPSSSSLAVGHDNRSSQQSIGSLSWLGTILGRYGSRSSRRSATSRRWPRESLLLPGL